MFSESRNNWGRRISDRAAADRLRDCDNAAEISDDAAGCRDRQYHCESDPMLNSVLNGEWSNSVAERQIPKGCAPSHYK